MAVARQYTTSAQVGTTESRRRLVLAKGGVAASPTVSLSVILLGIVAVLVGGWAAAAPYAGPDFGFAADRYTPWVWSSTSVYLALIPGAVALVGGLLVLAAATRPSFGRRPDLWLLGLVISACGAWFVVGQYAWTALGNGAFIVPSGATHFMWKELAFAAGPGVILVLCGALFMGWAVRREMAVVSERAGRSVATPVAQPVSPVGVATAPTGTMAPPPPVVTSQQPVAERPVDQAPAPGPVVEQPVATQAVVGEPVEQPSVEQQPVGEQPVVVRPETGGARTTY